MTPPTPGGCGARPACRRSSAPSPCSWPAPRCVCTPSPDTPGWFWLAVPAFSASALVGAFFVEYKWANLALDERDDLERRGAQGPAQAAPRRSTPRRHRGRLPQAPGRDRAALVALRARLARADGDDGITDRRRPRRAPRSLPSARPFGGGIGARAHRPRHDAPRRPQRPRAPGAHRRPGARAGPPNLRRAPERRARRDRLPSRRHRCSRRRPGWPRSCHRPRHWRRCAATATVTRRSPPGRPARRAHPNDRPPAPAAAVAPAVSTPAPPPPPALAAAVARRAGRRMAGVAGARRRRAHRGGERR